MNFTSLKSPAFLLGASVAGAFALLPVWSDGLSPDRYEGGRSRDQEARAIRNSSSAAIMLGEMRTAMSDIMFIKSERYLHSGVACKPHLQREILSVSGAMARADEQRRAASEVHHDGPCSGHDHEGHGEGELTCEVLIPEADEDFRGVIGYLERKVKPYFGPENPHAHTDGQELIPWFRVMTVSDPHYLPGYTTGAWWLKNDRPQEALDYLEEGLRNNPESFQIQFAKAQILLMLARESSAKGADSEGATRDLAYAAQATFAQAGQLAMAQWREQTPEETWTDYKMEDALASARMQVLTELKYGDKQAARDLARSYLDVVGEDAVLQRLSDEASDPFAEEAHGHEDMEQSTS